MDVPLVKLFDILARSLSPLFKRITGPGNNPLMARTVRETPVSVSSNTIQFDHSILPLGAASISLKVRL
jgi:hypothetical protein